MGLRISFLEPPGPVDAFRNRAYLIWVGLQKVRAPGAFLSLGPESDFGSFRSIFWVPMINIHE